MVGHDSDDDDDDKNIMGHRNQEPTRLAEAVVVTHNHFDPHLAGSLRAERSKEDKGIFYLENST